MGLQLSNEIKTKFKIYQWSEPSLAQINHPLFPDRIATYFLRCKLKFSFWSLFQFVFDISIHPLFPIKFEPETKNADLS